MPNQHVRENLTPSLVIVCSVLILASLAGCGTTPATEPDRSAEETIQTVGYRPLPGDDWEASTPEEQGLDPALIDELYEDAEELETLYSLLVFKDGFLIAEQYFNGGSVDEKTLIQSASKSYISALVGIAIEEGCLAGLDQKMIEFFPEVADEVTDPRKREVTIRQLLQMRSGYPDEETDSAYLEALYWGVYPPLIEAFPLVSEPGTDFHYSNLSYSWLAIILERACGPDLKDFARQHLFEPTETEVGDWLKDREGNFIGSGGIHVTARDAAKFGLLYMRHGAYEGAQVVPADWVDASLQTYTERARNYGWGFAFKDLGYGYGWWTASAGDHDFSFAWGHGGQLIVLLDDLDMLIVTTADPFFGQHNGDSWKHEKATFNLVGDFIASLPRE
ncbi:MAG: serine hydrolase domain-containing protein [Anaerolineales bacterium]